MSGGREGGKFPPSKFLQKSECANFESKIKIPDKGISTGEVYRQARYIGRQGISAGDIPIANNITDRIFPYPVCYTLFNYEICHINRPH